MLVYTQNGSVYQFKENRMRRVNEDWQLRRDGQWITLLSPVIPKVGYPMVMQLEPLSTEARMTLRTTSPVTRIEAEEN